MEHLAKDTIGGFNSMISDQKKEPGEAYVTTVLFDHRYKVLHDHIPLADVPEMTDKDYVPSGMTALLDAMGRTIDDVGERLSDTEESERPEKVIFIITTDGMENSSKEYRRDRIKEMVTHQREKYSWEFIFLGANMDAISEAESIGVNAMYCRTYAATAEGTEKLYKGVSIATSSMRSSAFAENSGNEMYAKAMAGLDMASASSGADEE